MKGLLDNARRIFDVARVAAENSPADEPQDFALLLRPDGGLHFIMETPFSLEGAASYTGAKSAWRITRSREGIRVEGHDTFSEVCLREPRIARRALIRDEVRYRITSPLLTSCTVSSSTGAGDVEAAIRRA
jgi:hypothetical protein